MSERIYRDPVHNIIRLRTDSDEGELMMSLIDTPEFQRLRRIKQLGLGLYTYQGAEHSRFTHSLGAFHLMSRVLDRLSENIPSTRRTARQSAPPLCFTTWAMARFRWMEKVLGSIMRNGPSKLCKVTDTEIGRLLRSFSPELPKVAQILGQVSAGGPGPTGFFAACRRSNGLPAARLVDDRREVWHL